MDFKNMKELIQQAKKMKEEMFKKKEILKNKEIKISNKDESIKIIFSGDNKLKSLKINPSIIEDKNIEILENLIIFIINEGLEEVKKVANKEMKSLTGGLDIPGL